MTLSGLLLSYWVHLIHLYYTSLRFYPALLLHIYTDTTYTVGRSIRDLRRRVSSSVIFVARSWCSFNVLYFYYYHYQVAFTTLFYLSYCSTGALGITPNLRSYRTPERAGHGKTLYLVRHKHIINESIMKHIHNAIYLHRFIVFSTICTRAHTTPKTLINTIYTCNNNNINTSYLYNNVGFPTICKASANKHLSFLPSERCFYHAPEVSKSTHTASFYDVKIY